MKTRTVVEDILGTCERGGSAVAKLGAVAGILAVSNKSMKASNGDEVAGAVFEVDGDGLPGVNADIPGGRRRDAEFGNGGQVFVNWGNLAVTRLENISKYILSRWK